MSHRSHRVALLAHCHLNANTKVKGLATHAGALRGLVEGLVSEGVGIVQLPCPEITYLGMNRWGMTIEQYDTPAYRRHCESLLTPVIDTVTDLVADGCEVVAVYGVDGSPSCGVLRTCAGYAGGEIEELAATGGVPTARDASGPGVYFEILSALLGKAGLTPPFIGIDERATG